MKVNSTQPTNQTMHTLKSQETEHLLYQPTQDKSTYNRSTPQVVWLVGSERSGTTWVSNLINYHQSYRYMFEPLHHKTQEMIPERQPYLYLNSLEDRGYLPMFEQIFSGQLEHPWVDNFCSRSSNYQGLLVKDIFGHMCLNWVHRHFPSVKIVFLLRHPFSVALSQTKVRWTSVKIYRALFNDPKIHADFLQHYGNVRLLAKGKFEKHIIAWAIVNHMALKQISPEQMHVAFYENICLNFEREMHRLFTYLGDTSYQQEKIHTSQASNDVRIEDRIPLDPRLIQQYRTPSALSRKDSAVNQGRNLVNVWRNQLTQAQIHRGDEILRLFGLGDIYNSSSLMPNQEGLDYFFKHSKDVDEQIAIRCRKSSLHSDQDIHQAHLSVSDKTASLISRIEALFRFR